MPLQEPARYRFGSFELDVFACDLRREGRTLVIAERSLQVLAHLVRHRGRVVPRDELLATVWPDVRVNAGSLNQAIWELRKTLREDGGFAAIRTARGRGYRFVARVEELEVSGAADRPSATALGQRMLKLAGPDLVAVLELVARLENRRAS